ncbi:uncharacterized protein LOC113203833 [Frankliniella occidentalis]|uniref:Uncharacterized protein LOC113203833 n=1 Tax=Frankliniella occidentalis TaxID=133901 RepID=A0A9C6X850_FRAOC|nr:uncharacterized protein LOC113203833 [Frankliniella occidentalis]
MSGATAVERGAAAPTSPNAQPLNWGAATSPTAGRRKGTPTSTQSPVRRRGGGVGDRGGGDRGGGWSSHEDWEEEVHEEEEDEGGWISWNKGHKKKGKGDIGSIFHISVTFLAFLAFGGYLLCLIMQAVKGNGYYNYPGAQGALRPAPNVMMVMMPNRAVTRRPGRPTGTTTGRRKRDATDQPPDGGQPASWRDWVPSFGEEDMRLLPEMDVDRMHRALLVVAEGYASFYHKKYTSVQP